MHRYSYAINCILHGVHWHDSWTRLWMIPKPGSFFAGQCARESVPQTRATIFREHKMHLFCKYSGVAVLASQKHVPSPENLFLPYYFGQSPPSKPSKLNPHIVMELCMPVGYDYCECQEGRFGIDATTEPKFTLAYHTDTACAKAVCMQGQENTEITPAPMSLA